MPKDIKTIDDKHSAFITSHVDPSKPLTLEDLEKGIETMRREAENPQPHYTQIPDYIVDEYLKRNIIPKFVIVSSRSYKKIEAKIEELNRERNN